jgi:TatD DNase family protein
VKAYYEFIPFCKNSKVPMLFHGFLGNEEILKGLSRFETSYFSFGKSIFQNLKIQELILKVNLNRLLLETDTGPFTIEQVYEKAASVLGLEMASLQSLLKKNALEFFGKNAFHNFGENSIE